MPIRSKYRNKPTIIDGIRFASKAEAKRYQELMLLERAGEITGLALQHRYKLLAQDGSVACTYVADFDYIDMRTDTRVTEDTKGIETPVFKIKAKLFEAQYGRPITIVRAA